MFKHTNIIFKNTARKKLEKHLFVYDKKNSTCRCISIQILKKKIKKYHTLSLIYIMYLQLKGCQAIQSLSSENFLPKPKKYLFCFKALYFSNIPKIMCEYDQISGHVSVTNRIPSDSLVPTFNINNISQQSTNPQIYYKSYAYVCVCVCMLPKCVSTYISRVYTKGLLKRTD